jgi:replicative DNA helicase
MKEVPKNRSAEISCLGSILIDQEAMVVVMPILRPADFFEGRHQDIFTAMLTLYNRGDSIDQITVAQELHSQKKLEEVDITYLSDLITEVPTSLHAEHYARIVKSHSIRRRLVSAGEQIGNLAYDETDPNVCISKADQILLTIQSDMATPHIITPSQLSEIGAVHYGNLRNPQHRVSISTGFEELDYHTGGMFPGDYIILAARAGLGKSQVALQMAQSAGKIAPVLFCPIEMHYKQILDRMVSSQSGIPIRNIRSGGYTDEMVDRIFSDALPQVHESGIYLLALNNDIVDTPVVTSTLIGTMARHMKMSYGLGLVVIDYIGLLDPISGDEKRSRTDQIRHISRRLKVMANSLQVPILCVAQINREAEKKADRRPELSSLRDSGSLEEDADGVWLLYRDDYYDPEATNKGEAEFWLAKQRQGKANIMLPLSWDSDYSRYRQIGTQPRFIRAPQEMPEEFL